MLLPIQGREWTPEEQARFNRVLEILLEADLKVLHDLLEEEKNKNAI